MDGVFGAGAGGVGARRLKPGLRGEGALGAVWLRGFASPFLAHVEPNAVVGERGCEGLVDTAAGLLLGGLSSGPGWCCGYLAQRRAGG